MADDMNSDWVADEGAVDSTGNIFKNILKGFGDLGEAKGEGA